MRWIIIFDQEHISILIGVLDIMGILRVYSDVKIRDSLYILNYFLYITTLTRVGTMVFKQRILTCHSFDHDRMILDESWVLLVGVMIKLRRISTLRYDYLGVGNIVNLMRLLTFPV